MSELFFFKRLSDPEEQRGRALLGDVAHVANVHSLQSSSRSSISFGAAGAASAGMVCHAHEIGMDCHHRRMKGNWS